MSMSYNIACTECRQHLWIGQGYGKRFRTYTAYRDEHKQRHLDRFLWEHRDHSFVLMNEGDDYEGLEPVAYSEMTD